MNMRTILAVLAVVATGTLLGGGLVGFAQGQSTQPASASAPSGEEVTLKGVLMWGMTCVPNPARGEQGLVLFAVEGTPKIQAEAEKIVQDFWTGDTLDCDQAQKLNDEWSNRLKFHITPGDVATKASKDCRWNNPRTAITGVISEKDGKKWITPSDIKLPVPLTYPAKMLLPDKPLSPAGKEPLVLKVTDTLSLKCILLPAGRFLQGSPFYQWRYQDEYPHDVTLTKPFYMAEIPVTQEMFQAVIGKNPSQAKGPQLAVENATWADINEFCRLLSEKNGVKVRIPTDAELEYAFRVGTSNPCLPDKYKDIISLAGTREAEPAPVKTKKPNAWGLYDTLCGGWTVDSDLKADNVRTKQVDPIGPPTGADNMYRTHGGWHYEHIRPSMHGAYSKKGSIYEGGSPIFRIVVEAGKPATAPATQPANAK
jgi:hypothetical protein